MTWVRLLPGGGEEPLRGGEHLFVGDMLVARFTNTGTARRFVSAVDIGLTGKVSVLTDAEPDGTDVGPGADYELGREWLGASGIALSWPTGLPEDVPRAESVVTIVADRRIDGLRTLEQAGVTQRGNASGGGSTLGRLLEEVATGRRDMRPTTPGTTPPVRYRVHRFDFVLHPVPRPDGGAEPRFEVDERPDPSFRLVVPRGVEPPSRVAVRLKELTVHRSRAFLASRVRVDALVVTAAPTGSGNPFQAGTVRFDRIRDGDCIPFDDLLVYEGPAGRFLDLAVWVARDDSPGLDLAELLAAQAANPDVAGALATLAGLGVAAPDASLIAGSAAAVAVLVRAAARAIEKATGTGIGVYRTSLLPHERFGSGSGVGRYPDSGLIRTQDMSFAFEVIDLDAVQAGPGCTASTAETAEDGGDDEAWRLVEDFDQRARETDEPDPELLDAVAGRADDGILLALGRQVAALGRGEEPDGAERYARHLLALATRLGEDDARAVRAAVDVSGAALDLRAADRAEATRRLESCGADLAELLPGLLGDREYVLAWLADEEGRTADAHEHAAAARDLFAQDERWTEAAYAAEAVAATHPTVTRSALDDWGRAASLHVEAGEPDEARRCVEQAGQQLSQTLAATEMADAPATAALCATARELALEHDLPALAARLGLAEAVYAGETGIPWSEVEARHEQSRAELAALDLEPVQRRGELARVDLSLARAAVTRGLVDESERRLAAALPALQEAGLDGEAQMCEGMLRTLAAARDPGSAGPVAEDRFTDPDVRLMLLMTDGMRLAARGRTDEALAKLTEATTVTGGTTGPLKTLVTDAATAAVRAAAGDRAALPAALASIDERLADTSLPHAARAALTQLADLLRRLPEPTPPMPAPLVHDVDAALAELRGLPADHPERPVRAVALVEALVRGDPMGDPAKLRPLDELLVISDGAVPETPQWVRTRTAARLLSLMRKLAERELADPDAAAPELDALAAEAGDDPGLAALVSAARWSLQVAQSVHHGDAGALTRLPQEMQAVMSRLPQGDPRMQGLQDTLQAALGFFSANEFDDDRAAQLDGLRQAVDQLPPGDLRAIFDDAAATMSPLLGLMRGGHAERVDDRRLQELQAAADRPGLTDLDRATAHAAVGMAALRGGQESDLGRVELGLTHMRRALDATDPASSHRVLHLTGLALAIYRRSEVTGSVTGLREAETLLEEARDAAGGPGHPMWQMTNEMLADVRRLLGGSDGGRLEVEGLRGHVWRVLAEPDLEGATVTVRRAAADAVETARRCLVANDPAAAITALDAGRGLALFAATAVGTFEERLRKAGDPQLAERWRAAAASGDPAQLPSDLRRAVLRAVIDGRRRRRPAGPPGVRRDPARAGGRRRGRAGVPRAGHRGAHRLRGLRTGRGGAALPRPPEPDHAERRPHPLLPGGERPGPVGRPRARPGAPDPAASDLIAANRELGGLPRRPRPHAPRPARRGRRRVCGWAWDAAMGPLIESLLPRLGTPPYHRPPRLVLVPMGDLARVPWQAARRPGDRRYAIELVAISQAVSARMLCRSARQQPVPPSPGGLVAGRPRRRTGCASLAAARREALAIRQVFYPAPGTWAAGRTARRARRAGARRRRSATGSPGSGAGGVLHLACHGVRRSRGRRDRRRTCSWRTGSELFAEELVALLARVPDRVDLAVLAACHSGVSMTGYDEAYSLGTAFLAGRCAVGAVHAVGRPGRGDLGPDVHGPPLRALRGPAGLGGAARGAAVDARPRPGRPERHAEAAPRRARTGEARRRRGVGRVRPLGPVMARRHVPEDDR